MAVNGLRGLTDDDRVVVDVEMFHRSLAFDNQNDLVQFAFSLWRDLDYPHGAKTREAQLPEIARIKLPEQAEREQEEVSRGTAAEAAAKQRHAAKTPNSPPVSKSSSNRLHLKPQG